MMLSSNGKVKIFTTSLIKSWSYQFLSLIDLKGIKKFIRKIFLALKARKAAKWPRTFYMVWTVVLTLNTHTKSNFYDNQTKWLLIKRPKFICTIMCQNIWFSESFSINSLCFI